MRIYRLRIIGNLVNGEQTKSVWFTRKADAPKIARDLISLDVDDTPNDPDLEEFKVPSKKSDLVRFLNLNCRL